MRIHFNTMVKDEGLLLGVVLPIWKDYPVDTFVFYDDNSTDDTVEVIHRHLGRDRVVILNDGLPKFHEAHHRSRMLDCSREGQADYVLSIDADELLSANLHANLEEVLATYDTVDTWLYWYNVVEGSLGWTRNDPSYAENYRSFILPLRHTGQLDRNQWKYHTPRVPKVDLPTARTRDFGILHLQSINRRFYALKQLWYKHWEFHEYGHTVEEINRRYDPVVNHLRFMATRTPGPIVGNLKFDAAIYDRIEEQKGYLAYVLAHRVPELVTFGRDYLDGED